MNFNWQKVKSASGGYQDIIYEKMDEENEKRERERKRERQRADEENKKREQKNEKIV